MKHDFYKTPKSHRVMRMLWKAAGGDRFLLEKATYADQIKYMCLGGVVVATGAMAGLAGGYAFYTIFSPKGSAISEDVHFPTVVLSIIFGFIWGLIIFNIDRFIVTSTGKGDGTEKITKDELIGAIPRIIMGMIIAITISKPMEIRMFEREINVKLHEKQIEQKQTYIRKIDSTFNADIQKKEKNIEKFTTRKAALESICDTLKTRIDYQIDHGGCLDKCEEYKLQLANNQNEIKTIESNPDYVGIKEDLLALESDRKAKIGEGETIANGLDGLLERIKICHEIAGGWITLFITLLFMAIELTPIFFKLMLIKTPYDYMDDNVKELIKAENGIEVRYDYYKDKKGIDRHLVINHEVERLVHETKLLTDIQKELTDYALQKYKEREQGKIDADLDGYIQKIEKNDSNEGQQA